MSDPLPIWDKESGEIDRAVATYWRDNYDLSYILRRDWDTLWPKVRPDTNAVLVECAAGSC